MEIFRELQTSGAISYGDHQGATNFRGHKLRRLSGSYKVLRL
jgi:hypothetical protein